MNIRDADELAIFFDISKQEADELIRSLNPRTQDMGALDEFLNHSLSLSSLRGAVIFFLLFFVDAVMLLLIFADPYVEIYRTLLVPPIILLHPYALWIIINPKKRQIASRLYVGVFAAFVSVGYLVLIQKFLYSILALDSKIYGIVVILGALLALVGFCSFIIGKVKRGTFFDGGNNKGIAIISGASSLGIIVGDVTLSMFRGQVAYLWIRCLYVLSLVMMFLAVIMIYRYILIRRYPDLYVQENY